MQDRPKAHTEGLISETVGDDVVVYDSASTTAHSLSAGAAAVWSLCDGTLTIDELGTRAGVTREFVEATLVELERTNLIETTSTFGGMSRRDFGRLATRAAIAAPIILSVAVPVAQAAISCRVANTGTTDTCSAAAGGFGSSNAGGPGTSCCTSGNCYKSNNGTNYCVASPTSCKAVGGTCSTNGDCCAQQCNMGQGKCQH